MFAIRCCLILHTGPLNFVHHIQKDSSLLSRIWFLICTENLRFYAGYLSYSWLILGNMGRTIRHMGEITPEGFLPRMLFESCFQKCYLHMCWTLWEGTFKVMIVFFFQATTKNLFVVPNKISIYSGCLNPIGLLKLHFKQGLLFRFRENAKR